jgi:hypothetical protein
MMSPLRAETVSSRATPIRGMTAQTGDTAMTAMCENAPNHPTCQAMKAIAKISTRWTSVEIS